MGRYLSVLFFLLLVIGCSTTTTSNTARTGTEQLLVSNAIDQSLNKVDFTPFAGRNVFLEDKYLECVDKNYLISSVRHRLMRAGAVVVPNVDSADVVLEPRSGGVGTHASGTFIGVPEIVLPGMLTLPETRLVERKNQKGVAKIGFVAYDAKSRTPLGTGGVALSESDDNNWFVLGMGPYQNGTLQEEVKESRKKSAGSKKASPIPSNVAFAAPTLPPAEVGPLHAPGKVQLASGEEKGAPPATKSAESPEWAR